MEIIESKTLEPSEAFIEMEIGHEWDGVVLFVKSPLVHRFFSRLALPEDPIRANKKWALRFFNIKPESLPVLQDVTLDTIGGALFAGEMLNLSFLRASDLDKGIEVKIPGPTAFPIIKSFKEGYREKIQLFYSHYLQTGRERIVITTKSIGG